MSEAKTRKEYTENFYEDVRKEYHRMKNIKDKGVSKYSYEYILVTLSEKFYRAQKTIENIIWGRV